jgi:N-acyl-D-amino-acid deacylase
VSGKLDLAITGAELIDGTGAPRRLADVGVAGDRIAVVAEPGVLAADEVVEARGLVVCPGFIDIMSHSLWPLFVDGRSLSKLVQGVTTEVMGEGYSPAPHGGLVREPEPWVEGIDQAWLERIRGWRRFGDWLEALERNGVSPNVASFIGGGTVREYACGMRTGAASSAELDVMREVVADAMRDGAMGVAYALIYPRTPTPPPTRSRRWPGWWRRPAACTCPTSGRRATGCSRASTRPSRSPAAPARPPRSTTSRRRAGPATGI